MDLRILALGAAMAVLAPSAALAQPPQERSTVLTFQNQLPKSYRLVHMTLLVDGTVRYDGPAFGTAYVPPGQHVVELVADYRMHSSVLTYMNGYAVQVRSAHILRPAPNRPMRLVAVAVHAGGATTPLEKSAVIDWYDR